MLSKVLELLGLNYYEKNGKVIIINSEENTYSLLKQNNGKSSFDITKNGEKIHCNFNDNNSSINLAIGSKVYIFMSPNTISYSKRDLEEGDISYIDFIKGESISIFKEKNNISTTVTISIKDGKYDSITKTVISKDHKGATRGETIIFGNPSAIAKNRITQYNREGKMLRGTVYEDQLYLSTNEYIKEELSYNPLLLEILTEMEEAVPGIIDYTSNDNSLIKEIYTENEKHFK